MPEYNATIWRVRSRFGKLEPVDVSPVRYNGIHAHADMLRYDLAFCNPDNVGEIIMPIFKHTKKGKSSKQITFARWSSFGYVLDELKEKRFGVFDDWLTYRHPAGDFHKLVPQTLKEYMSEQKVKITTFR